MSRMPYHTVSALPTALLDLTMLRLGSTRGMGGLSHWKRASGCRRMHQATALKPTPPPSFEEFMDSGAKAHARYRQQVGSLVVKTASTSKVSLHPVQELERRVQALDEAIEAGQMAFSPSFYSEEELMGLYEDVLAVPPPQPSESNDQAAVEAVQRAEAEEDLKIINALDQRLCNASEEAGMESVAYRRILTRAHEIIARTEAIRNTVNPNASAIPMGMLSIREFEALIRATMKAGDAHASEVALNIMKRDNLALPQDTVTKILKLYADTGNMQAADSLLASFLTESPTELQRHLHVQAHLNGTPRDTLPTSALDVLHHYEGQNVAVPMQTYTSVITSLFTRPLSLARAHAWDIFTHMRYVAHPNPDVVLYTLMIRACASPVSTRVSSEPEKALDLWTEMTVDQKIPPTVGAYNAVILACARSGTKTYVNEAFRLARQMLDSHRDARGFSAFRPDRKTFCALLEGAKRIGDLGRARWILAEMVRGARSGDGNAVDAEIDEEIMMHVFHAYAAYKPPFQRSAAVLVKDESASKIQLHQADGATTAVQVSDEAPSPSSSTSLIVEDEDEQPSFAHIPPQSRSEVIREVNVLFNRILQDRSDIESIATASFPFSQKKFKNVELTTRLLSSYLSVFYKHASLETSRELFWTLFDNHGLERSLRTYVEALERCGNSRRGQERDIALRFADEIWARWKTMEELGHVDGKPLNPRLVERGHVAMIRVLAITEHTDRAMEQLRSFAAKYSPNEVRTPSPKLALQSTRTSLVGARPLVRMTSAAEVPDDHVPPLITFRDIEVLHHRLIDEERKKDIKYVTWMCKAYEWALRVRRDETVKAKPGGERNGKSLAVR